MTPVALYLLLGACLSSALVIYGWPRRAAPGASLFAPLIACITAGSGAAALEMVATNPATRLIWNRVSWIGIVALPLCWLLFCVDFTGSWSSIRSARAVALLASPAIALIALLTANWFEPVESMVPAAVGSQPMLLALSRLYGWLLFLLGMALLVRRYARSASVYRAQCGSLILAGSIPAVVHLLHLVGFDPLGGVDPTLFSFNVAALVLGWGLFSYRLFDVTPIAYETVFNAIGDGVVVTDSRGQVTSVNPIALETLGRGLDDVLGRKIDELYNTKPQSPPATVSASQRGRSAAGQLDPTAGGALAPELIELNVRRAGRDRDVEIRAFPVYDGERRLYGRVYISQDVTDRNAYQRRIEEMAYRDFLTKLPNRRALYADAQRAIAFARRRRQDAALLFFDLDRFKDVNDALGHPAGDLLLQYVASRLQSAARKEDSLARLGGDEFALLLYDCDAAGARAAAERLIRSLREPAFEVRRTRLNLDASVGIAMYTGGDKTVEELIAQADVALYRAKQGPDRIHLYQAMEEPAVDGCIRPEDEFIEAMRTRQLIFKYQPIVDLASGNVHAVEALVRWEHPTRGLTHPSSFLAMVEERDLALELDRYALTHAMAEVVDSPYDVCINLSARSVLDRQLVDIVSTALRSSGLPPRRLILEITERALAVPELTRPVLFDLRKLGVRIAADDFGTGYSALAYLRHFPLSMLKLDRFLVAGIGRRVEDEAIIRAVIMIARTMGLLVIGEGVETREQMRWLDAQGCNAAQGFHLARPERWETFLAWAESRSAEGARRLKLVS
jgi:diguanylate cyclase (GGDEF)-like protein/PAS domain S-box-containing protein